MANLTHPKMMRGRESPKTTANAPQSYVVEDMTHNMPDEDLDRKLAEFEGKTTDNANERPVERPVPPAVETKVPTDKDRVKALENLIFIGRHTKEVDLGGHKFELGTLTHRENNDIVAELMNLGDAADLFTVRVLTLAYALRKIDGVELDDMPIDLEFNDRMHKRMTIIDYLQLGVVERLHKAYEEMVKESTESVFGEKIKN
jgi:hypothetical protein